MWHILHIYTNAAIHGITETPLEARFRNDTYHMYRTVRTVTCGPSLTDRIGSPLTPLENSPQAGEGYDGPHLQGGRSTRCGTRRGSTDCKLDSAKGEVPGKCALFFLLAGLRSFVATLWAKCNAVVAEIAWGRSKRRVVSVSPPFISLPFSHGFSLCIGLFHVEKRKRTLPILFCSENGKKME